MGLFGKNYRTETDEALMMLCAEKDSRAFSELYDRYSERMTNYFYRMLNQDRAKAEDFMQDLFTKIINKPQLFDPKRQFRPWIYSVANNMCKNEYRRLSVRNQSAYGLPEDGPAVKTIDNPSRNMDLKAFNEQLYEELDKLDEKQRSTFIMRYKHELSIKEISAIMECSEGTVKSRLFYTLKKLSVSLEVFDPHEKEDKYE